jgi:aldehyde:ferredoxin oxidoreductase
MFGYAGKTLEVDLSKASVRQFPTPEKLLRDFIGARGLAAALLHKYLEPGTDPLTPGNPLIFATGPVTGTQLPACARSAAAMRSPLTNTYLCSSAGAFFGAELKFAGFDCLILKGKAERPSWLHISEEGAELRDAPEIWGMNTDEAERTIRRELQDPKLSVLTIGPAGERLVRFSCIQIDMLRGGRSGSFGRGGCGAVMGSKLLKAIAVHGSKGVEVADKEGYSELLRRLREDMRTNPLIQNFSRWGTPQFVGPINEARMWPTRNFTRGSFEGAEKLMPERLRSKLVKRDTTCYACTIASGKLSEVESGPYAGTLVDGPEYETIWSFGPQCGIDSLEAIAAANLWCDRFGLDTISAGNAVGFAMECAERGLLSEEGLDLRFGNHEVLLPMLERIAFRRGIGEVLAEGVRRAAERIGNSAPSYAMHVKGCEIPAYDPRGAWGMALAYATSCRGACHLKAWTIGAEILRGESNRFSTQGKAALVVELQNVRAFVDSMGVCVFGTRTIGIKEMLAMLQHVVGWSMSEAELVRTGERIYNVERLIAVRDGITRKDDTLPPRLLSEALPELPESRLTEGDLNRMLDEYYGLRGWDSEGRPTERKLEELGLTVTCGRVVL